MVLEDAHWLDPTTRDLFDLTVESVARLRVLLVVTARPEAVPLWQGHTHVTALTLNRLVGRQVEALVAKVAGGKPLPAEVVEQIRGRTDGVPLFVEELTRAVLESGYSGTPATDGYLTDHCRRSQSATLHDSLMARLDRLAVVKEVAQVAACIGREFGTNCLPLWHLFRRSSCTVRWTRLVAAQLVFCRGTPPDAVYTFKHALVQDVAYQSLLKSRRQQLHAAIARALRRRSDGNPLGIHPKFCAHTSPRPDWSSRRLAGGSRLANSPIDRSAYVEAVHHLQRGLEVLTSLPANTRDESSTRVAPVARARCRASQWSAVSSHETGRPLNGALSRGVGFGWRSLGCSPC
jgi:hypothetical protein